MSTFSSDKQLPIPFAVFARRGWSVSDYYQYRFLCLSIRAAVITGVVSNYDRDTSIGADEQISDSFNKLIVWLEEKTGEHYSFQYDVVGYLRQRIYYCLNPEDGIEYYIVSENDYRAIIEEMIIEQREGVTINAQPLNMYCGTKAEAETLKGKLEEEYISQRKSLEALSKDMIDDVDGYAYIKAKARIFDALDYLDIRIKDIEVRIREFEDGGEFDPKLNILYVHKGLIKCERDHHHIVSVNAILPKPGFGRISLNVNFCRDCKRFFVSYIEYMHYRSVYGILLAKLILVGEDGEIESSELALESPLKLSGYNVSAAAGLSQKTREQILAGFIDNGIISKPEIIRYINHFILMNGKKKGNETARRKWENDLKFLREYGCSKQENHVISEIQKYPGTGK